MSDPAAGYAWERYCAHNCEGIYDPTRHAAEALETFMTTLISAPPLSWTGSRTEAGGAAPPASLLVFGRRDGREVAASFVGVALVGHLAGDEV